MEGDRMSVMIDMVDGRSMPSGRDGCLTVRGKALGSVVLVCK